MIKRWSTVLLAFLVALTLTLPLSAQTRRGGARQTSAPATKAEKDAKRAAEAKARAEAKAKAAKAKADANAIKNNAKKK